MPTVSPARLSGRFLSFVEREEIAVLHAQGHGVRETARRLGRSETDPRRILRARLAHDDDVDQLTQALNRLQPVAGAIQTFTRMKASA